MQAPNRGPIRQFFYLVGLYLQYARIYTKTLAEYPMDTWISILSGIMIFGSSLIFLGATLSRTPQLAGWTFYQMIFLFSIASIGRGLTVIFFNAPYSLHGNIRRGTMDGMLVKPVGTLFQMIGFSQEFFGLGGVCSGIAVICYAAPRLGIDWSGGKVIYLIVAIGCSMLIQFSILLLVATPGFWVLEMRSVIYPVGWLVDFARYPLEIYTPFLRVLLTYILPYAFGGFYPAAYLLRPDQYGWALYGVPAVTAVLVWLAYRFWRFGLNYYSSAT